MSHLTNRLIGAVLIIVSSASISFAQVLTSDGASTLVWGTRFAEDQQTIDYLALEQDSLLKISLSNDPHILSLNISNTGLSLIRDTDLSTSVSAEGPIQMNIGSRWLKLSESNTNTRLGISGVGLILGNGAGINAATLDSENTLVGAQSGTQITTGIRNTFVGYNSGQDVIGSRNVCIGANTGNGTNVGSGNVIIGYTGNVGSNTNNKLYIGNSSGTLLVEGDFASNVLKFNSQLVATKAPVALNSFTGRFYNDSFNAVQDLPNTRFNGLKITAGQTDNSVGGSNINSRFMEFYKPNGVAIASIKQNNNSSVNFDTNSDERLKTNIQTTRFGLSDLLRIEVRDYHFVNEPNKPSTGFIAQQLYHYFPEAVAKGGEDVKTNPWRVDYSRVTPIIAQAIQEQDELLMDNAESLEQLRQKSDQNESDIAAIKSLLQSN